MQEEDGEDSNSVLSGSPQAMLPSAAQPLSCRGRARYDISDSTDGLQDALPSQVCCPLASSEPQACQPLYLVIALSDVQATMCQCVGNGHAILLSRMVWCL